MLDEETYQEYYRTSYFCSLLFNQNVEKFLDYSYEKGIITNEEDLLNFLYGFINANNDIIPCSPNVLNNLYKILFKVSVKNIDKANAIKLLINKCNTKSDLLDNFLIVQYISRNYGVSGFQDLNFLELYKFSKLDMSFFYKFEEQIYSSLTFDFQLINSLSEEPMFDECMNNYKFLGSLNYFKCFYPMMFQDDCFLEFANGILKFQSINKFNIDDENCLIRNCSIQNKKLLKYVQKSLKDLKK